MRIKTGFFRGALVCLIVAFTAGCASQKGWVYRANTFSPAERRIDKKVVVLPFEDGRTNKNNNLVLLYAVPLLPYGWQTLNTPEVCGQHINSGIWVNYKPTEDFPKAIAEDLRKTGLFNEAFFDFKTGDSDYVVRGKIVSTKYEGKLYSYLLGFEGPALWIIGLPATQTKNELEVEMSLTESKGNRVLLTKRYAAAKRSDLSWLYYVKEDFNYAEMFAEISKEFCNEIRPLALSGVPAQSASVSSTTVP